MNEIEMVKIYQATKDKQIELYFIDTYLEHIQKYAFDVINQRYNSIPIEFDDVMSIAYQSMIETLEFFDLNDTKISLKKALFRNAISLLAKQASHYTKGGHYVLNYAWSMESDDFAKIRKASAYEPEKQWINDLEKEMFFDNDDEQNKWIIKSNVKQIIYLKSNGHKNEEIAKMLNVDAKRISNVLTYLRRKVKKRSLM